VSKLYEAGFSVRQISQEDPRLAVSSYSPGSELTADQLSALLIAADSLVELGVADSAIDDDDLRIIAQLTRLRALNIANNQITSEGLSALSGLSELGHLNIYGNADVNDRAFDVLAQLPNLAELYVWKTGLSDTSIARLQAQRRSLSIHGASAFPIAGAKSK
jgi:hypothetical protein